REPGVLQRFQRAAAWATPLHPNPIALGTTGTRRSRASAPVVEVLASRDAVSAAEVSRLKQSRLMAASRRGRASPKARGWILRYASDSRSRNRSAGRAGRVRHRTAGSGRETR